MDARIRDALEEMHRRMAERVTISVLAATVQLSASRFAHLFRAETGFRPMSHLQSIRMRHARVLLENASLSIREVMMQVGYRDAGHFARDFRRHHGVSPRECRMELRRRDTARSL